MNLKLIVLGVFAIVSSYLLLSIPLTSATNVKIYYNGAYQSSVQYNPQSLIKKDVSVESGSVKIGISNTTAGASVERVYVYSCKGLAPDACISSVSPEAGEGNFAAAYPWNSVADRTAGYPQKANFIILVKISSAGKVFWTGFWQWIERTDASTYTAYESRTSEMEVHAKDIDDVAAIRNFIANNMLIPFNPEWVTRIVFPPASGLYLIKSGLQEIENQQFTTSVIAQNQLTSIDKDHGFAFADISNSVFSPVTLNLNPDYTCGNNNCETPLGESQANCCMDCGCQNGYYCDSGYGCRQTAGISLSLYGTPVTKVSNCNQQHVLNIVARINNPPTGMSIASARYKLGSSPYQTASCSGGSGTGYIFSCPVTVPAVPGCDAGTYKIGPNYINFSISYPNGASTASGHIAASFPEITIGSYTCGSNGCESSLGESESVCCYDCGCPSGYCDVQASQPEAGACKQDPSNQNLRVLGLNPPSFYTHKAGDHVSFLYQVSNSPMTLAVSGQACSIRCSRNDGQACTATCDVSCSKASSSDASVYNSSCSMGFSIAAYDPLKGYSLFPTLNVSVSYKNGSANTLQRVLSSAVPTISIGAHWCGDRKCDPDESSLTCCYDCPCAQGQYCDTKDLTYRSEGDSCRQKPEIQLESIGSTAFTDSYEEHAINVTGHVSGRPGGLQLTPFCSLDSIACYSSCEETGGDSSTYGFLCQIIVPSIDYNTSALYDPATKKITINPNGLNLTLSYNNGPSKQTDSFSFAIPESVINVIPRCGNDICERSVGETGKTCCTDCECLKDYGKGYFCYQGKSPNGECLSTSAIDMRIQSIEPDPVKCTILQLGGKCIFTQSLKVYPLVLNPPSDLEVIDSYYRINNSGNYTPLNCYKITGEEGNYSCSIALENIPKSSPGKETRTIDLKMSMGYTLSGALMVANLSDQKAFTVSREYSEAVESCLQQQQSIDRKLKDLKKDKTLYTILAIIFFIISLVFWIIYYISCSETCTDTYKTIAIIAAIVGGCGLAYALNRLSSIDGKIQQLQAQKQQICASSTFGGLSSSTSSATNWIYTIGQLYGSITCTMGVTGAVGGLSWGGTNSAGSGAGQMNSGYQPVMSEGGAAFS